MKVAYFDCIAGASGDMILGALLDAGLPEPTLREGLAALRLDGFTLSPRRVVKNGFGATKVDVLVSNDVPARRLPEIEAIIAGSSLDPGIARRAIAIFRRLGEVEASIHGVTPDQVHLHELGGMDTIVDVVGALLGLEALGIERVYASPLPVGRGFVQGAHGAIPLPAPATLALLARYESPSGGGVPVIGVDLEMELVTPTGAALLSSLAAGFGPIPPMRVTAVGYGAGERDLPIPNLLRLLVGDQAQPDEAVTETLTLLETNIDDLNPELYDYVMARLFDAGALDVFLSPIHMKKNRPATLLRAICRPADASALMSILYAETSTLGVREQMVTRHCLERAIHTLETPYGAVRVKVASLGGGRVKVAPEYEDCRRLAETSGVPLREVYRAAEVAAEELLS
ncbi:MAG: nickel pincer cofactor biosynthesis protein LarC [Anaerolineae bacterium]